MYTLLGRRQRPAASLSNPRLPSTTYAFPANNRAPSGASLLPTPYQFGNPWSVPQGGQLMRACLPSAASPSRAAMSSLSSVMVWRLDEMRDGVTDLGSTTVPRWTAQEMRTVAVEAECLSAIFCKAGSAWSGDSGD